MGDMPSEAIVPPEVGEIILTEPGVYGPDLVPLEAYVADPVPWGSLSASGAKLLLPPSCPAKFEWWRDHPEDRATSDAFDFGTAVHTMVTGVGPAHITVTALNKDGVPVTDWRTTAAKDEARAIRAAGGVPLLLKDAERVTAAVDKLWAHPLGRRLFDCPGTPEATMVWPDEETGVWRRARPDRLPDSTMARLVVPDLKTCDSADPRACEKATWNFGYHRQAATVLDGLAALEVDNDAAFVLVFLEKTPPYCVTVVEPDEDELEAGREQNRRALRLYADCVEAGRWPEYSDEVITASMPRWAKYEMDEVL